MKIGRSQVIQYSFGKGAAVIDKGNTVDQEFARA